MNQLFDYNSFLRPDAELVPLWSQLFNISVGQVSKPDAELVPLWRGWPQAGGGQAKNKIFRTCLTHYSHNSQFQA